MNLQEDIDRIKEGKKKGNEENSKTEKVNASITSKQIISSNTKVSSR